MATVPSGYRVAHQLTVTATTAVSGSTGVPTTSSTDYVCRMYLVGNAAALVWGMLADKAAGTDLTIWRGGTQIDCDVETVGVGAISVWFKLQANIVGNSSDAGYVLAYGNPSPIVTANWANIYNLSDDFLGTGLDGSKWVQYNGPVVTVTGSILTIGWGVPANHSQDPVHTVVKFPVGYTARGRGTMPFSGVGQQRFCIHNGDSDENGNSTRHQAVIMASDGWSPTGTPNTGGRYDVMSFDDDGSGTWAVASPALIACDSAYHTFNVAKDANAYAYGWIDEGAVSTTTGQPATLPGWVYMSPVGEGVGVGYGTTSNVQQTWDWIKVRPFVPAEPTTALGPPSFFPPPSSPFLF